MERVVESGAEAQKTGWHDYAFANRHGSEAGIKNPSLDQLVVILLASLQIEVEGGLSLVDRTAQISAVLAQLIWRASGSEGGPRVEALIVGIVEEGTPKLLRAGVR